MSERDDYYGTKLNRIDEHIEAAERLLDNVTPHDCGNRAEINAMLALVLVLVEIGSVVGEIRDDMRAMKEGNHETKNK